MKTRRRGAVNVGAWLEKAGSYLESRKVSETEANAEFLMAYVLGAGRADAKAASARMLTDKQGHNFWELVKERGRPFRRRRDLPASCHAGRTGAPLPWADQDAEDPPRPPACPRARGGGALDSDTRDGRILRETTPHLGVFIFGRHLNDDSGRCASLFDHTDQKVAIQGSLEDCG